MKKDKFQKYDIWYADFPFDNITQSKDRPVLIINTDGQIKALALMITSTGKRDDFDIEIEQYSEAGLDHKSVIRLHQRYNLPSECFRKKIGTLQQGDKLRLMLKSSC